MICMTIGAIRVKVISLSNGNNSKPFYICKSVCTVSLCCTCTEGIYTRYIFQIGEGYAALLRGGGGGLAVVGGGVGLV